MKILSARLWAILGTVGLFVLSTMLTPSPNIAQSQSPSPDLTRGFNPLLQATQTIESDDPRVIQSGAWSTQTTPAASNGNYLFNDPSPVGAGRSPAQSPSPSADDPLLALAFVGSAIEIMYVSGPQFGTLAIEVDGTVLRTVITTTEKIEYGLSAKIDYLSDEPHTVKVYAQSGGIIAVDAFLISPISPIVGDGPVPSQAMPTNDDSGIQSSTCAPLNVIQLVSRRPAGPESNANSFSGNPSGNGRYVAFYSDANNLVAGDANGMGDIFVYDRLTCDLSIVSVSTAGVIGNGVSSVASLSDNGRYITFVSAATNLVAGDTNASDDIFVHDQQTHTTTRVSVTTGGTQGNTHSEFPSISADGRYVAFGSFATNLVAGDTNAFGDIFLHDRQTNTTTRISVATGGTQSIGGASNDPAISADGRYVAFASLATNLVAGDTNGLQDIFLHDRQTATTTRISVATGGIQANATSLAAAISADGRYTAFQSTATNLVAGDTNAQSDVFVHDRQTGTTTRVSVATGGTQSVGAVIFGLDISGDGRYVAFDSQAGDLVAGDTNNTWDIFVHDRNTVTTSRVSLNRAGEQTNGGASPFLSADGRYVGFDSIAGDLVIGDNNGFFDIFVTPRVQIATDTLALFNPPFQQVNALNSITDNPPASAYTAFSAYAPVAGGQWVMGDWNGDGLETPGVYNNGPFYYTNKLGESQATDWRGLWIGINGPPVAGHFNSAFSNDCIGAVQQAALSGFTVFVLYYTCDLSGNTAPTISSQWLSSVLPDSLGLTGQRQFSAGDYDGDGAETIAVRRDGYIAYTNVAVPLPAEFGFAQFIGTPATTDYGILVVGDWNADGISSFGLFYQTGELFYRNDLLFNSGGYFNQSVGQPFAGTVQATTWR